jgi:hypothetical protein
MRYDEPRRVWTSLATGRPEEPGTSTQGAPVFPGSSRLGLGCSRMYGCNGQFADRPVCVFIVRGGEGDSGGHVLRETTSRGLCGLVCPSPSSERGGQCSRYSSYSHPRSAFSSAARRT